MPWEQEVFTRKKGQAIRHRPSVSPLHKKVTAYFYIEAVYVNIQYSRCRVPQEYKLSKTNKGPTRAQGWSSSSSKILSDSDIFVSGNFGPSMVSRLTNQDELFAEVEAD